MLIVYQSLNSGTHTVGTPEAEKSALNSHFTRATHASLPDEFHVLDTISAPPFSPPNTLCPGIYFNANAVTPNAVGTKKKRSSCRTPLEAGIQTNRELVQKVITQINIEVACSYGNAPQIIVLGEIYLRKGVHVDHHYTVLDSINNDKACQSFTVLIHKDLRSSLVKIESSQTSVKYPILTYNGIRIGFVHIPNAIANNTAATVNFFNPDAANIDIVMGDTNFHSQAKLQQVGADVWAWKKDSTTGHHGSVPMAFPFNDATTSAIHPRAQNVGTNAREDQLYDQGISNIPGSIFSNSTVDWSAPEPVHGPQPAFQFLGVLGKCISLDDGTVIPFSDHSGLVISIIEPTKRTKKEDDDDDVPPTKKAKHS